MSDKINKAKVELVSFNKVDDINTFKYSVEHNNGKTSVEQELTLKATDGLFHPKWVASIALDDFPEKDSPEAAALKLADWLERLALAIRAGEYQELKKSEFKDVQQLKANDER